MWFYFTLAVVLALALNVAQAGEADRLFRTVSGRHISRARLTSVVPGADDAKLRRVLFEHVYDTHGSRLVAHDDRSISIPMHRVNGGLKKTSVRSTARRRRWRRWRGEVKFFLNGELRKSPRSPHLVRTEDGAVYVFSNGEGEEQSKQIEQQDEDKGRTYGRLLHAWGPGFQLLPLHDDFPDVFVNVHQHDQFDLLSDMLHKPSDTALPRSYVSPLSDKPLYRFLSALKSFSPSNIQTAFSTSARTTTTSSSTTSSISSASTMAPFARHHVRQAENNGQAGRNSDVYFEVVAGYDNAFCAKHGNNPAVAQQVLQAIFSEVHLLFYDVVDLQLVAVFGSCNSRKDPFSNPSGLAQCVRQGSSRCSTAEMILEKFAKFWVSQATTVTYDAAYVVSGWDDGSPIAGAAYVRAACNSKFKFGWVEATNGVINPVVLAHEIGHTLGAQHDSSGIMQSSLSNIDRKYMSPNSIGQMRSFINGISDKGCLVAHVGTTPSGRLTSHFVTVRGSIWVATDVAFGRTSANQNTTDLYMLYGRREPNSYAFQYTWGVVYPESNERIPFLDHDTKLRYIPLPRQTYHAAAGLTVASVSSRDADDLVLFTVVGDVGKYYVGRKLNATGYVTNGWSPPVNLPFKLGAGVKCVGLTSGHIRGNRKTDLLFIYVQELEGVNFAFYTIAFDVRVDGRVRKGWTDPMQVPGSLEIPTGDIGAQLIDLDGKGGLDLVVSYTQKEDTLWRTNIIIGEKLSRYGLITGSWSRQQLDTRSTRVPGIDLLTGGLAVKKIGKWPRPVTAIIESRQFPDSAYNAVELAHDFLSNRSVKTFRLNNPITKCQECFSAERVAQCEAELDVCLSQSTQLRIETLTTTTTTETTTTTTRTSTIPDDTIDRTSFTFRQTAIGNDTPAESDEPYILGDPDTDSITCEAFQFVYLTDKRGCKSDLEPRVEVALGTAEAVRKDILAAIKESAASTSGQPVNFTLDDFQVKDVAESSGSYRRPVTVKVWLQSKEKTRRNIITAAVRKLKSRAGFGTIFIPNSIKIRMYRRKGITTVYIVRFSAKFEREFAIKL